MRVFGSSLISRLLSFQYTPIICLKKTHLHKIYIVQWLAKFLACSTKFWVFPITLSHLNVAWCYKMVTNFRQHFCGGKVSYFFTCKLTSTISQDPKSWRPSNRLREQNWWTEIRSCHISFKECHVKSNAVTEFTVISHNIKFAPVFESQTLGYKPNPVSC